MKIQHSYVHNLSWFEYLHLNCYCVWMRVWYKVFRFDNETHHRSLVHFCFIFLGFQDSLCVFVHGKKTTTSDRTFYTSCPLRLQSGSKFHAQSEPLTPVPLSSITNHLCPNHHSSNSSKWLHHCTVPFWHHAFKRTLLLPTSTIPL